jgi:hypothetical protein
MQRSGRAAVVLACLVAASTLSGCGTISQKLGEKMSELPAVGLPANAPDRPVTQTAYPAVHDIPPGRNTVILDDAAQQKMEDDLLAARAQQQAIAASAAEEQTAAAASAPPPAPVPSAARKKAAPPPAASARAAPASR